MATPSPNGTIVTNPAGHIVDANGDTWQLVQTSTQGQKIAVNGVVDPTTYFVTKLEYYDGAVYQENIGNNWWYKTTPSQSWIATTFVPPQPPPSPDGTTLNSTNGQIVDAAGNTWSLVQIPNEGMVVALNGVVDFHYNFSQFVTELEYSGGKVYQENVAGNWWYKTTPASPWTSTSAPLPPPGPSVATWINPNGGSWNTASNWYPNVVPAYPTGGYGIPYPSYAVQFIGSKRLFGKSSLRDSPAV